VTKALTDADADVAEAVDTRRWCADCDLMVTITRRTAQSVPAQDRGRCDEQPDSAAGR
jgi:hypothetical protein